MLGLSRFIKSCNIKKKFGVRFLANQATPSQKGTAIVMMNLGGPETLDQVYDFLCRLFSDREIIQLPFQKLAGPILARRRTPEIQHQYAAIGGGSPIRKWTNGQGEALCRKLDDLSPSTAPHKHYIAFRYANPLTNEALEAIKSDGIKRAIAFTQYPQYSCTTTGSSINELYRTIISQGLDDVRWSVIDRWGGNPLLAQTFAKLIKEELHHWPENERNSVVLVFSAHSIPHRVVDRGDPYPIEVADTVQQVMRALNHSNPYRLVWQSKVGPLPWLGPKTMDALKGFHSHGIKNVVIIPIAFTSDHIETLFELDQTYVAEANRLGMNVRRCKALNMESGFIDAMSQIVLEHFKSPASSIQFGLRCPGCNNEYCQKSKEFFFDQSREVKML